MPQSNGNRQKSLTPGLAPAQAQPPAENTPPCPSESTSSPTQVSRQSGSNLILPRSPLLGREYEITRIQHLLLQEQIGLLTLTGPGGIGKTRLAMQVAANLLDHFVDGVYFVSLAPISDPKLVSTTIAQTLGVREAAGRPLQESLQSYLRDKQLLLVLDNFEQILAAAPLVSALLNHCQRLKVLVTSRASLHLYSEQEIPVSPLALPDAKRISTVGQASTTQLTEFAAIDLFCQRARAVKPDFALTPDNAATVAQICIGLDGLPLAIELAAARIKLFSPSALLARLDQRLTLLTGGAHDLPTRQRTLRDEIAWSYDLLTAEEQRLFRRLSVFVDGFTLEAAKAVGNAQGDLTLDVLDGIITLVDQSLLKQREQPGGEARFGMLETIREYGLERLEASDEAEAIRHHHADFFLALAEATAPMLREEQAQGLARLLGEHANLRTALAWSLGDSNATELALRLLGALQDFWLLTGYRREGSQWFDAALARTTAADRTTARTHALIGAGMLDDPAAYLRLEEGLAIAKERGEKRLMAVALERLGWAAQGQQDNALATARFQESLAIGREIGDKYQIGSNLCHLAGLARDEQDYTGAQSLLEESLAVFRELGAEWDTADVLHYLGQLARLQGDYLRAGALYRESLARWRALGTLRWKGVVECLAGLAHIGVVHQQFVEAARLFGAADALWQALFPFSYNAAGAELKALCTQLGEVAFAEAWAAGSALSTEQAVDYAVALPEIPVATSSPVMPRLAAPAPPPYPAGLTAREVEVLRLLAHRLTYVQIAEQLVVSRRTINTHVSSIYSKLGVNSREAATRFAADHHLL